MKHKSTNATCRGCGCNLIVYNGVLAYRADSIDRADSIEAKTCFYGGWVCSRKCDVDACVQMESSMPGAGKASSPGCFSMRQIRSNWDEEER